MTFKIVNARETFSYNVSNFYTYNTSKSNFYFSYDF